LNDLVDHFTLNSDFEP